MRYLSLILTFFLLSIVAKANENNFFNEAKDLFDKEKYEDSKSWGVKSPENNIFENKSWACTSLSSHKNSSSFKASLKFFSFRSL